MSVGPVAVRADEAAELLRVSRDFFDERIAPDVPVIDLGRVKLYPVVAPLAAILAEHAPRQGLLMPGRDPARPCSQAALRVRLRGRWMGLDRFGFHDLRHGFASMAIAAGMNPKEIQEAMGHSSIQVTFDLYGHLFPGARDRARETLDAWIAAQPLPTETKNVAV